MENFCFSRFPKAYIQLSLVLVTSSAWRKRFAHIAANTHAKLKVRVPQVVQHRGLVRDQMHK